VASGTGCDKADECSAVKEEDSLTVPIVFFVFVGPTSKARNSL
jgi:hypothetical protein